MHKDAKVLTVRPRWQWLCTVCLLSFLPSLALAENVKVLSEEKRIRRFEMPLIYEVSLEELLAKPAGEAWTTMETKYLQVDDVTLGETTLKVRPSVKGKDLLLEMAVDCVNESRRDKRLTFLVEGLDGDEVLCRHPVAETVEQGDRGRITGVVPLRPKERWGRQPFPRLRVTLTVANY